jgi:large subunit ribosomal protein L47
MRLFRSSLLKALPFQFRAVSEKERLVQFSSFHYEETKAAKPKDGEEEKINKHIINTGRSWKIDELRIKSNDDLHKLWYVLLREKNAILADACVFEKISGEKMPKSRLEKVEKSMTRLQQIIKERKETRENFRKHLENEYSLKMKEKLEAQYEEEKLNENISPKISFALLRSKFESLRLGKDDQGYLHHHVHVQNQKQKFKEYLRDKYAYGKKKLIDPETMEPEELANLNKEDHIFKFKNSIEQQLQNNQSRISQEEILRAHIKNWKMLDLKQRRVVLNYLNNRRSRDAKSAFIKELNLLAQKITYEEKNLAQAA